MNAYSSSSDAAGRNQFKAYANRWAGLLLVALLPLVAGGCGMFNTRSLFAKSDDVILGPGFQPANVHRGNNRLPTTVRRVVILPVTCNAQEPAALAGQEALQPMVAEELGKTRAFEVIAVTPEQLQKLTGRSQWMAEDKLPEDFFSRLREVYDCDAVLFAHLSQFRAYPPLQIGWKVRLVDNQTPKIHWAVDEVFDAGEAAVATAARRYYLAHLADGRSENDSRSILFSPRRFGQYSLNALFDTLPGR